MNKGYKIRLINADGVYRWLFGARSVASGWIGWTMPRGPECPGQPQPKLYHLGPLTVPCPWVPEGLATPVIGANLWWLSDLVNFGEQLTLYLIKCQQF